MSAAAAGELALAELRAVVGADHARAAGPSDHVDGVPADIVVAPGSAREAALALKLASARGLAIVARGGASKLGWGSPPEHADVILETRRLDRVLEHVAGDLVLRAEAGVGLAAVQERLAPEGQWLALDPPEAGATLGGVVATGASGPHRLGSGSVRDLLIGVGVALADGTLAKAGGKVVKNVAGYDLCKLFTGSLGTLGLIVEVTFRLHPRPAARRLLVLEQRRPGEAGAAVQALLGSSLVPSAVELGWNAAGGGLAVLFEGVAPGVEARAAAAVELLRPHGRPGLVADHAFTEEWARWTARPWRGEDLGLELSVLPSALPDVLEAVLEEASRQGLTARIGGRAASGALLAALSGGDARDQASALSALRRRLALREASAVVRSAGARTKPALDVWGEGAGGALDLMRRVKERFDPGRNLSPGRFVGGL